MFGIAINIYSKNVRFYIWNLSATLDGFVYMSHEHFNNFRLNAIDSVCWTIDAIQVIKLSLVEFSLFM